MNDEGVLNSIERLVQEEHTLLDQNEESRATETHERLAAVEVELDRCWDLLRQRREFHQDPDDASVRDEGTVERYLQ
jgi:Protein of unknown function (DUF2630)